MFNIDVIEDTWFEIEMLYGETGTFTENMMFEFEGGNPYNQYYIEAIDPAFQILRTSEEGYGSAVAYDAGTYKTIGSTVEFGGLIDGESPSTKAELMAKYLNFFGDILTDLDEQEFASSENSVNVYPNPARDEVNFTFNVDVAGEYSLEIYSVNGQRISSVFEGRMTTGQQRLTWNGLNDAGQEIPGGFYFYQLNTPDGVVSGKVLMMK
jgi:hypothetical protein